MDAVDRRTALATVFAGTLATGGRLQAAPNGAGAGKSGPVWALEGSLKTHPKFLYRFFIELLDGQRCALFGADHERETAELKAVKLPARVRVLGRLGTEHHSGGDSKNLSPFPEGWIVYMDVEKVDVLK